MPTARYWSALKLFTAWIGVFASLVVVWWVLQTGIYTAVLGERGVQRVGGAWSAGFARGAWAFAAGSALMCMAALTATWIRGREARASSRAAEAAVHRSVLI